MCACWARCRAVDTDCTTFPQESTGHRRHHVGLHCQYIQPLRPHWSRGKGHSWVGCRGGRGVRIASYMWQTALWILIYRCRWLVPFCPISLRVRITRRSIGSIFLLFDFIALRRWNSSYLCYRIKKQFRFDSTSDDGLFVRSALRVVSHW